MHLWACAAALSSALAASSPDASAPRSLDHAGSVGLFAAAGAETSTSEIADCLNCPSERVLVGSSALLDLGATVAVGEKSSELVLRFRLTRLSDQAGESLLVGYRQYFGRDEWKTFFSFDLQGVFRPVQTLGARAALGVMRELSEVLGLFAEAGASFGLGSGRRFGGELTLGIQGRSYLLE